MIYASVARGLPTTGGNSFSLNIAVVEVRYRATRRRADYGRAGVSGERGDSALTGFRRSGFATLDKIRIMAKRA